MRREGDAGAPGLCFASAHRLFCSGAQSRGVGGGEMLISSRPWAESRRLASPVGLSWFSRDHLQLSGIVQAWHADGPRFNLQHFQLKGCQLEGR